MKKRLSAILMIFVLALTATACQKTQNSTQVNTVSLDKDLPVVGSFEKLKSLLKESAKSSRQYGIMAEDSTRSAQKSIVNAERSLGAGDEKGDFSRTNVQVEGVDEADVVKTDGKYIYKVNNGRVIVAQAVPAGEMKIVTTLDYKKENFSPNEIYVDDKYLVVIGGAYNKDLASSAGSPPTNAPGAEIAPAEPGPDVAIYPPIGQQTTKVIIYDISDKTKIKKMRDAELEGSYISSRKIGSALYLVANKYIDVYTIMEQKKELPTVSYRDSAAGNKFVSIDYKDIRYFPNSPDPNYLMVAGLNLDQPTQKLQVSTYLGSGQNIYASEKNLYVAVTRYEEPADNKSEKKKKSAENQSSKAGNADEPVSSDIVRPSPMVTALYKFALNEGQVKYTAKGSVPGTILNQFSMDEYQEHFRVATTIAEPWRSDRADASSNNVYILDGALKNTGKLENIAPGEHIYSARFVGGRAYLVTFKTVDPFFVIDLQDPKAPKILGALKIPGYSNYLHPYDENHIIGFGKDTEEVAQKDWEGKSAGNIALYQGMKMAIFDVTDVKKPTEMFNKKIGDRGTDSELLYNHKALLFDKEKKLLAFPVTVMENKNADKNQDPFQYGEFTFQGAFVYHVDLENGFVQSGRITHLTQEDFRKSAHDGSEVSRYVERVLYIGDTLYTLSQGMIKATDMNNMKDIKNLGIPH